MKFKQAGIPSNIIWENKSIRGLEKIVRMIMCFLIVAAMSVIAFILIIRIKTESNNLNQKYVSTDCDDFYKMYSADEIQQQTAFSYMDEISKNSQHSNAALA